MESLLELFEELTRVSRETKSFETSFPINGDIEEIDFRFGAPCKGRLPFFIIRDGHKYPLGKLCDCYPFIDILHGWMERAVTPTFIGRRRNEGVTIECDDGVIELSLSPTNLEPLSVLSKSREYCIVGILKIKHVSMQSFTYECFCDVEKTVYNLYTALQSTLIKNCKMFDDKKNWMMFDRVKPFKIGESTSQTLKKQWYSEIIEIIGDSFCR